MAKGQRFWAWFGPAALVYAAGFAAAALYDLDISTALYTPGSLFGALMEALGWFPAFLPAILAALMLAHRGFAARRRRLRAVLCVFLAAGGLAGMYYAAARYLQHRGLLGPGRGGAALLWLLAGLALAAGMWAFVCRLPAALQDRVFFFAVASAALMALNQGVVYALKAVWGRVRFDDMALLGRFDLFAPWYRPFGPGGSSFPSGHTANAAGVFALLALCDVFPAWARRRPLVLACCWAYVAAMAFSRVLIGRHFLSDTLAASALMALAFYFLRRSPVYQKSLRRVQRGTPPGPKER